MMGPFKSEKYGTIYKVYIDCNTGSWELYNVTSDRVVHTAPLNTKSPHWKGNFKARIKSKLRKYVIRFEKRIIISGKRSRSDQSRKET